MIIFLLACFNTPIPKNSSIHAKNSLSRTPIPSCQQQIQDLDLTNLANPKDPRLKSKKLIVLQKTTRTVMLYNQGKLMPGACWFMGLGFAPKGHKKKEGDGKTPEGWYQTSDKPESRYYGAIAIHYPNTADVEAGKQLQLISAKIEQELLAALQTNQKPNQQTPLGGEILIHGGGSSSDWTLGCAAMNNDDLDQLRALLPVGMQTNILILP